MIYLSSIKTKLAINILKKKLLHLAEKRAGAERVNWHSITIYILWKMEYYIYWVFSHNLAGREQRMNTDKVSLTYL